jgi:predicted transcriptional regulator
VDGILARDNNLDFFHKVDKVYKVNNENIRSFSMKTITVSARLDSKTIKKLDRLAKATARSKSFLAAEAIRAYVEEQAWQIEAIEEGVRQADAGDFAGMEEIKEAFARWFHAG